MIRDIITYPTPPSVEYSVDVRSCNDEIISLIEDLKDTIEANSLDGLSAFQIGNRYNVVVVKDEHGKFIELINPRVINVSQKITTVEKTAYFPGLSAEVARYNSISVVYEDRELKQHSLRAEGAFSILLQRKIDYTFGSSFINKLSKEEREIFERKLDYGSDVAISESCPTTFKRDYIIKVINVVMIGMVLLLISSLFIQEEVTLGTMWDYQLYLSFFVVILNTVYFFYAQYEGKKYSSCSSCQIGNIMGTTVISLVKLSFLMMFSYFLI